MSSSASRAARSCPPTTRCSTRPGSGTSSSATSRAPATPPRVTRRPPARSASAWRPPGPGATNLVTPIADAYMDSVPIVAITGQVGRPMIGTDAFQEADISGITLPITKHNFLVQDPAEHPAGDRRGVPPGLDRPARARCSSTCPRTCCRRPTTFSWPPRHRPARLQAGDPSARQADPRGRPADRRGAPSGALRRRRRPQGRARPRSCSQLAELTGIPVVTTLMARGAFPDSHRQHLGMPGMHGSVAAVTALQKADLLIALGTRFDDRVTGRLDTLRAARGDHPRRHRPGRDRQEPRRRTCRSSATCARCCVSWCRPCAPSSTPGTGPT